jgi:hypothetical protein
MSFYLAETPTLEAVATEDERELAQDLKARVAEAVEQAESHTAVGEAAARSSRRRIVWSGCGPRNARSPAREGIARVGVETSAKALEGLVEAAAPGKLEFKKLDELAAGEAQIRTLGLALEKLPSI